MLDILKTPEPLPPAPQQTAEDAESLEVPEVSTQVEPEVEDGRKRCVEEIETATILKPEIPTPATPTPVALPEKECLDYFEEFFIVSAMKSYDFEGFQVLQTWLFGGLTNSN